MRYSNTFVLERCFAWGPNLQARPEKSLAPILPESHGFNFTEFDTAVAADARTLCAVEKARRNGARHGSSSPANATGAPVAATLFVRLTLEHARAVDPPERE